MEINVFGKKSSQDASWADLGQIWVAKGHPRGGLLEAKLGSKRVTTNDAKKGLVVRRLGGGWMQIAVGSLCAGSDKGETCLPPERLVELRFCLKQTFLVQA